MRIRFARHSFISSSRSASSTSARFPISLLPFFISLSAIWGAYQNGVDVKTVSNMPGHYDAGFTLRAYTHAARQMQNQVAETMGNFMAQIM